MRHALLTGIVLTAGSLFAATPAATKPATQPAETPEAQRARVLAKLTQAVAEAKDPSSAAAAYARANVVDPSNVKLHEIYMVKMLKFGMLKVAIYPARALVGLDGKHILAWSVIGYVHGKKGELVQAFEATMLAVEHMQDNPSVTNNAGQLVAWFDRDPDAPQVSAAARRVLEQVRGKLAANKEYAQAYQRVAEAYKERASLRAEFESKLPAAEATVRTLRQQVTEVDSEYRAIADDIDSRNRLIDSMRRELGYYYWYNHYPNGEYNHYRQLRRTELRDRIRDEERTVDQLRQQAYRIRSAAETIRAELIAREKSLAAFRDDRDKAMGRVYRQFRWDPPAVDGVVTPEVEYFVYRAPIGTKVAEDPEALAAQRLKIAKLYTDHKLPEKALEILTEIVTTYGSTKSAEQARSMLDAMKPDR